MVLIFLQRNEKNTTLDLPELRIVLYVLLKKIGGILSLRVLLLQGMMGTTSFSNLHHPSLLFSFHINDRPVKIENSVNLLEEFQAYVAGCSGLWQIIGGDHYSVRSSLQSLYALVIRL